MLNFLTKFLKFIERWEYFDPSSFWLFTGVIYLCFNLCLNNFNTVNSSENILQSKLVIEQLQGGAQDDATRAQPPRVQPPSTEVTS